MIAGDQSKELKFTFASGLGAFDDRQFLDNPVGRKNRHHVCFGCPLRQHANKKLVL